MQRTKFIVRKTDTGVILVQLHLHESLKDTDGHLEVTMDEGNIIEFDTYQLAHSGLYQERVEAKEERKKGRPLGSKNKPKELTSGS